jgi:uncharacterized protein (DUF983 family)
MPEPVNVDWTMSFICPDCGQGTLMRSAVNLKLEKCTACGYNSPAGRYASLATEVNRGELEGGTDDPRKGH